MQKQVWYFHYVFPFDFINENIFSTTVTYPLDLIKGRLQIQGEIAFEQHAKNQTKRLIPNRGMFGTAVGIGKICFDFSFLFSTINPSLSRCFLLNKVQEEGFLRLWQGLSPAIYRHIGKFLLFVVYSIFRMI